MKNSASSGVKIYKNGVTIEVPQSQLKFGMLNPKISNKIKDGITREDAEYLEKRNIKTYIMGGM